MKTLMKIAFIGLFAISTTAFAGNKNKKKGEKKHHQVTNTCPASCPKKGC